MVAAAMLSATSCTDFSDYNDTYIDGNASADRTLWENINGDSNLSQFASLLTKAGYDKILNSANSFTVWAPVNGSFDMTQYESLDSAKLVQQFVKNHIANYNYIVSGVWSTPKRIRTLNNKSYDFANNGTCTFDGLNVTATNIAGNNGVMHKIDGVAPYYPNILDFFSDTTTVKSLGIDSVAAYFNKYNESYLDESKSVVGPIVNGKQTYIDSVMVTYNTLANRLRARISDEDSSYTVLLPTNAAWKAELSKAADAYKLKQYIPYRGVDGNNTVVDQVYTVSKVNYLKDSLAHESLAQMLVFSNNDTYNEGFLANSFSGTDSVRTPTKTKFSSPANLLLHVNSKVGMSNGMGLVMDTLAYNSWDTYCYERSFTPTSSNVIKVTLGSASRTSVTFTDKLRNSETVSWYNVQPSGTNSPKVEVLLPDVTSGTYSVYVVLAPPYSTASAAIDTLPNKYKFTMYYSQVGENTTTTTTLRFSADGAINPSQNKQKAFVVDNSYSRRFDENGKALPDTMKVGEITLPVSYASTGVGPSLLIETNVKLTERSKYSREIRLMKVLLRPVSKGDYNATKED